MNDRSFHVEQYPLEQLFACPLCGHPALQKVAVVRDHSISKENFELTDCASCGFRITNPRPSQNDLGGYYQSDTYISHGTSDHTLQSRLYLLARKWALRQKLALIQRYQSNGRVLDVGCGTGEFLAYLMSRGYLVQGVEPSLRAREQAIAQHGLSVVPTIEQLPAQEQFQVLTMWHVLEHVPAPRATFKRLFALLAERGLLVIAVPDRGAWDSAHYGPYWAAWDVPRHLSHFRRIDVHTMLSEHGFELVATKRMWLDAFYIAMLSEQYRGSSKPMSLAKALPIGIWSNLLSLFSGRPTSSTLYVARKIVV